MHSMFQNRRIYLDFASITPIDKIVSKAMRKTESFFSNPSSLYKEGVEARKIIESSRKEVASLLSADRSEIFFTSGGTESNNLAIIGLYQKAKKVLAERKMVPHVVVSSIEHSSILECVKHLETLGVSVTYIEPNGDGIIDPKQVREALRPETFLVSIQMVNNEIGTIQPIGEIAKMIRHFKKHNTDNGISTFPFFHSDVCQAFNYISINVLKLHVDLLTLDGGKVYGPRGSGVLYKRNGVDIEPLFFGGGQEQGLRSGTENIQAVVGISKALSLSDKRREKECARLSILQKYFFEKIKKEIPEASVNGSLVNRVPNNVNICIKGLDAEFAVFQFDAKGISLSSASSCLSKNENSYSYVVKAIRPSEKCHESSLRISLGIGTSKHDIDQFFMVYKKIKSITM